MDRIIKILEGRTIKLDLKLFVPEFLGGRKDNYFNAFSDWLHYHKFRSLVQEVKPKKIMEIGVLHGDGAERMIKEGKKTGVRRISYYGFDLFERPPKHEKIRKKVFSVNKIRERLSKLPAEIHLYRGDTKETIPENLDNLPIMDFIYIDGGHSYETCKSDWENSRKLMGKKTLAVFDDYEVFSGVTRTIDEIDNSCWSVRIIDSGRLDGSKYALVTKRLENHKLNLKLSKISRSS